MSKSIKKVIRVISLLVISVLLFVALTYLSEYFLLPILPNPWQTNIVWLGSAALGTIAVLSGLAQLTGYSLKDFFASTDSLTQSPSSQDSQGDVLLNVGSYGRIDRIGDILQGNSTKIVVDSAEVINNQKTNKAANVENFVRDIQSALYDDNSKLPYVLTLCLDLCNQVNLSDKYEKWLRIELNGYKNYQNFREAFENEDQFENWMQNWAPHRLIKPYIKFAYHRSEDGQYVVDPLPLREILVAFPVAEIARMIRSARDSNTQEFSLLLRSLSREQFQEVKDLIAELSPEMEVPPDLQVFYTVSNLEQILNGVRSTVLSLLTEARQQVSDE